MDIWIENNGHGKGQSNDRREQWGDECGGNGEVNGE